MGRRTWQRRRWWTAAAAVLALLTALALEPSAVAAAQTPPVMTAASATYLALGDSYASGEGVEPFLPGTDEPRNRCHRSTQAYSRLLAAAPGMPPAAEFWACSGARIANFSPGRGQWDEAGQLEHLNADTQLVTLSVGGNDLQFAKVLVTCLFTRNCNRTLALLAHVLLRRTEPRLGELYRQVLTRAGSAQVFVIGYPRFVAVQPTALCVLAGLEPAEARWLNTEVVDADAALHRIVDGIADPRLHYISTLDAFAGGEACSATPTFVHGLVPAHLAYSFHPTAAGQAALATRIRPALLP